MIIDLFSQANFFDRQTWGWSLKDKIVLLKRWGKVVEIRSGAGVGYVFTSSVGIVTRFGVSEGRFVFLGDQTTISPPQD